jgi:hypothetical protein
MNARDYYNTSKCYSDYHLMWLVSLKKKNHVLGLMRGERIHDSIGEKLAAILGNLHLILVHYMLHQTHANF